MLDDALAALGLGDEHAAQFLDVVSWVDQEIAHETYGYPKDNEIPPSLSERLASPAYVSRLAEAAAQLDVDACILEAIRQFA